MTGASAEDHININNSNLQPELKYHVVHEIMNEQIQEVKYKENLYETDVEKCWNIE